MGEEGRKRQVKKPRLGSEPRFRSKMPSYRADSLTEILVVTLLAFHILALLGQ